MIVVGTGPQVDGWLFAVYGAAHCFTESGSFDLVPVGEFNGYRSFLGVEELWKMGVTSSDV